MRHSFYIGKKYQRSVLFPRHRFLGKNKQERPCSEAKRRDACPRKTIRDEQKSAILLVREKLHTIFSFKGRRDSALLYSY